MSNEEPTFTPEEIAARKAKREAESKARTDAMNARHKAQNEKPARPATETEKGNRCAAKSHSGARAVQGDCRAPVKWVHSTGSYCHAHAQQRGLLPKVEKAESDLPSEAAFYQGGFMPEAENSFRAAAILTDSQTVPMEKIRQALREWEDDLQAAALSAFGLEVNDANRKALDAIMDMLDDQAPLKKAQVKIEAGDEDSEEVAEIIQRAFQSGAYQAVSLKGKHSKGTIVCKDSVTEESSYLIKPGSGKPSPASGVRQESASQSVREVAFYRVADEIGLGEFVPRADLILMDGKEVAAMALVPFDYQTVDKIIKTDPNFPNRMFEKYRKSGTLHKWALLDYVFANVDRHGGNVMCDKEGSVFLIDHGSAFAGDAFDPAHDKSSFIPFYLRSWARMKQFDKLTFAEKLKNMPRVSQDAEIVLKEWLRQIKDHQIAGILSKMGIDPKPSLNRLAKVKGMVDDGGAVDAVLNKLWVST